MNKKMKNILIMSDSRGRDLEPLLNGEGTNYKYKVVVAPGAQVGKLSRMLTQKLKQENIYDLAMIFGGICSITRITYNPSRAAILRHSTEDELVQCFVNECDSTFGKETCGIPTLLIPLIGMDLMVYAGSSDTSLHYMQPILDSTVVRINKYIKRVNDLKGLPTPNTSSCIHRCRGKDRGYRTHYRKLYDGCHPTEEVLYTWSEAIKNCCKLIYKI